MEGFVYWIGSHTIVPMLAISTVFTAFWLIRLRERLRISRLEAVVLSVLHVMIGIVAVSLFAFLEDPKGYSLGVQSLFGGVFFMPPVYWAWAKSTKRDCRAVFDAFAISLIFTLMCARANCLVAGCCLGKVISGTNGLLWPTREMELLFYIVMLVIYLPKVLNGKTHGEIYPRYMLCYGIFRFVVESFRSGNGWFHLSHIWAILSLCVGAGFLLEHNSKRKRGDRGR